MVYLHRNCRKDESSSTQLNRTLAIGENFQNSGLIHFSPAIARQYYEVCDIFFTDHMKAGLEITLNFTLNNK